MKNHNEMYQSLLSRYEEYQEKKKKRIRVIKYTVPLIASFCFCIGIIGYWNHVENNQFTSVHPDDMNSIQIEDPEITTSAVSESQLSHQISNKTENVSSTAPVLETEKDTKITVTEIQTKPVTAAAYTNENKKTEQDTIMNTELQIPASSASDNTEKPVTRIPVSSEPVTETYPITQIPETTPVQTTEAAPPDKPLNIREIKFGYREDGISYKPGPPQKIVMKCMSFCRSGETLNVDTAMADEAINGSGYENTSEYKFEVYAGDSNTLVNIEDERLIVNGDLKGYVKEYSKDEAGLFDIHEDTNNYDMYHHVTTEIDFSNYRYGDSGCLIFAFRAVNKENPLNPTYSGSIQRMYFYMGESGISVSALSIEDAMENYQELWIL